MTSRIFEFLKKYDQVESAMKWNQHLIPCHMLLVHPKPPETRKRNNLNGHVRYLIQYFLSSRTNQPCNTIFHFGHTRVEKLYDILNLLKSLDPFQILSLSVTRLYMRFHLSIKTFMNNKTLLRHVQVAQFIHPGTRKYCKERNIDSIHSFIPLSLYFEKQLI